MKTFFENTRVVCSILVLSGLLGITACKHDPVQDMMPAIAKDTTKVDTSACDTSNVTYSITIKKVLNNNCLRCHGSSVYMSQGSGYNFDDYTVLKSEVDNGHVAKAINHEPGAVPMPLDKTEKISDCEIRKMMIWIAAGAPQN